MIEITQRSTDTKPVSQVNSRTKFYGALFRNTRKSQIRKTDYEGGYFELYDIKDYYTEGNSFSYCTRIKTNDIETFIKYLLNDGYIVYEFDSLVEFAKWAAS